MCFLQVIKFFISSIVITANLVAKIAFICYRITAKNQKTILIKRNIYSKKSKHQKQKS